LCEKCESSKVHYNGHPLVKMVRPMCGRHRGGDHFQGLSEVMGRRCGRRRFEAGMDSPMWCGRRGHESGMESPMCARRRHESGMESPMCGRRGGRRGHMPCWMRFACKDQSMCGKEDKKKYKQGKLQNRKEKLLRKLSQVNSKLSGSENTEAHLNTLKILCVCGAVLVPISPMGAYNSTQVMCDRCDANCSQEEIVFHCPVERSSQHPHGYDVCLMCANEENKKMPSAAEPKCEQQPIKEEQSPVVKEEEPESRENTEVSDPFAQFQYAAEARCLTEMGFSESERIMSLLASKNGNIEEVLAELISQ